MTLHRRPEYLDEILLQFERQRINAAESVPSRHGGEYDLSISRYAMGVDVCQNGNCLFVGPDQLRGLIEALQEMEDRS
jgi:hypothetical protein